MLFHIIPYFSDKKPSFSNPKKIIKSQFFYFLFCNYIRPVQVEWRIVIDQIHTFGLKSKKQAFAHTPFYLNCPDIQIEEREGGNTFSINSFCGRIRILSSICCRRLFLKCSSSRRKSTRDLLTHPKQCILLKLKENKVK